MLLDLSSSSSRGWAQQQLPGLYCGCTGVFMGLVVVPLMQGDEPDSADEGDDEAGDGGSGVLEKYSGVKVRSCMFHDLTCHKRPTQVAPAVLLKVDEAALFQASNQCDGCFELGLVVVNRLLCVAGGSAPAEPHVAQPFMVPCTAWCVLQVRVAFSKGNETVALKLLSGGQKTLVALALIIRHPALRPGSLLPV